MIQNKRMLPEYGKSFARPFRLSPKGKKQVKVTPRVLEFTGNYQGKNLLERAEKIVEAITRFKRVVLPLEKAKRLWGMRGADDVIKTKTVFVEADSKEKTAKGEPAIGGCHDYAKAVVACLRAIGLPVIYVRAHNHSYTKFLYRGTVFIADPSYGKGLRVRKMRLIDKMDEDISREKGSYAEGASPAQIGLHTHADFTRYSE